MPGLYPVKCSTTDLLFFQQSQVRKNVSSRKKIEGYNVLILHGHIAAPKIRRLNC